MLKFTVPQRTRHFHEGIKTSAMWSRQDNVEQPLRIYSFPISSTNSISNSTWYAWTQIN